MHEHKCVCAFVFCVLDSLSEFVFDRVCASRSRLPSTNLPCFVCVQVFPSLCAAVGRSSGAFDPQHAASASVATSNLFAFYDCIADGAADGNSKVNAAALQGLLDALGALPPSGLAKMGSQMLELLARVRGSNNRDVARLGAACFERLLDRLPAGRAVSLVTGQLTQKVKASAASNGGGGGGGREGGSTVAQLLDALALQMQRLASNGAGDTKAKQVVVKKVLPLVEKLVGGAADTANSTGCVSVDCTLYAVLLLHVRACTSECGAPPSLSLLDFIDSCGSLARYYVAHADGPVTGDASEARTTQP